jgi:hypothetical protein
MSKNKYLIFSFIVLLVFAGGLAAVYQFYLQPRFEEYKRLEETSAALDKKLSDFESTFSGVRPEVVVEEWNKALPSWNEAVANRALYYRVDSQTRVDPMPEAQFPQFYYEEKYSELLQGLYRDAIAKGQQVPGNISFGVPPPGGAGQGRDIKKEDAEKWLNQLAQGIDTVNMLMDSGAAQLLAVNFWPPRTESNVLEMRTVGVSMYITLPRLLDFFERVAYDRNRFYSIDGFKIANRTLRASGDPYLQVDFLLTQAEYKEGATPTRAASGMGGASMFGEGDSPFASMFGGGRPAQRTVRKKSWWQKLWPF